MQMPGVQGKGSQVRCDLFGNTLAAAVGFENKVANMPKTYTGGLSKG